MEKIFKLKENGTTVRTEIVAGLTTFMTMAYIIALNPNLLTGFDVGSALWNGVFLATCIAPAISLLLMDIDLESNAGVLSGKVLGEAAVLLGMLCASAVYWAGSFAFLHKEQKTTSIK